MVEIKGCLSTAYSIADKLYKGVNNSLDTLEQSLGLGKNPLRDDIIKWFKQAGYAATEDESSAGANVGYPKIFGFIWAMKELNYVPATVFPIDENNVEVGYGSFAGYFDWRQFVGEPSPRAFVVVNNTDQFGLRHLSNSLPAIEKVIKNYIDDRSSAWEVNPELVVVSSAEFIESGSYRGFCKRYIPGIEDKIWDVAIKSNQVRKQIEKHGYHATMDDPSVIDFLNRFTWTRQEPKPRSIFK